MSEFWRLGHAIRCHENTTPHPDLVSGGLRCSRRESAVAALHTSYDTHNDMKTYLIKIDVDFVRSTSEKAQPTDIIAKISEPYIHSDLP